MALKSAELILSTWYEREKESLEVLNLLLNLEILSAEVRGQLEGIKKEDQRHASFLKERARQLGHDLKAAEDKKESLIEELKKVLNDISDAEKLKFLAKTLRKLKKDKMRLFQKYLVLKTGDILTSELLERINISESSHLLKLEAMEIKES